MPAVFMAENARSPANEAAAAASVATFSLVDHSTYIPASLATLAKLSTISEDGVPG